MSLTVGSASVLDLVAVDPYRPQRVRVRPVEDHVAWIPERGHKQGTANGTGGIGTSIGNNHLTGVRADGNRAQGRHHGSANISAHLALSRRSNTLKEVTVWRAPGIAHDANLVIELQNETELECIREVGRKECLTEHRAPKVQGAETESSMPVT